MRCHWLTHHCHIILKFEFPGVSRWVWSVRNLSQNCCIWGEVQGANDSSMNRHAHDSWWSHDVKKKPLHKKQEQNEFSEPCACNLTRNEHNPANVHKEMWPQMLGSTASQSILNDLMLYQPMRPKWASDLCGWVYKLQTYSNVDRGAFQSIRELT